MIREAIVNKGDYSIIFSEKSKKEPENKGRTLCVI